jgi:hypothetical protein
MSFDPNEILDVISQNNNNRFQQLEEYALEYSSDCSDEEENPISAKFLEKDNQAMVHMTNFTIGEFNELFAIVSSTLSQTRRGRKPKISPKDSFFFLLHYFKTYPKIEVLASQYKIPISRLEKCLKSTIEQVSEVLQQRFISEISRFEQHLRGIGFQNFPDCISVIDVCFQPIYRPKVSFQEQTVYYSGKHHSHGVKVECTHAANGVLIRYSDVYPGSYHDFKIFCDNIDWHKKFNKKEGEDGYWGILADKGYQGINEKIPGSITPKKKLQTKQINSSTNL